MAGWGVGVEWSTAAPTHPTPERIDVYFNHKLSPGGYSYLFILDGVATFGCAIVADFKQIDSYFDHSLAAAQRLHHFDVPADARTGYSYMNFHLKHAATSNGARFVGEAAGFQDYLFGLGIRYALTSGSLAARSILEERDYDELWKSELGAKQQTSLVNRFLYETGGNFGLSMFVRQAARAKDFHHYLSGWHRSSVVEVAALAGRAARVETRRAAASTSRGRTGAARAIPK